jgi:hypothetical protein
VALIGEAGPEAVVPLNRSPGNAPLPSGFGASGVDMEQAIYRAGARLVSDRQLVITSKPNLNDLDLLVGTA